MCCPSQDVHCTRFGNFPTIAMIVCSVTARQRVHQESQLRPTRKGLCTGISPRYQSHGLVSLGAPHRDCNRDGKNRISGYETHPIPGSFSCPGERPGAQEAWGGFAQLLKKSSNNGALRRSGTDFFRIRHLTCVVLLALSKKRPLLGGLGRTTVRSISLSEVENS